MKVDRLWRSPRGWQWACAGFVLCVLACMGSYRALAFIYPQGVAFTGCEASIESCFWNWDANNPGPCPLVIHLPEGDLGERELADAKALKGAGWEERDAGKGISELIRRAKPPYVACWYEGGRLSGVHIDTLDCNGGGPAVLTVNGQKLSLPAPLESIIAILGQPLRRDPP